MYRFYEREKFEGKTYQVSGVTRISERALRHVSKVGPLLYVRGYVARCRDGIIRQFVEVRGETGSVRFGGFSWGYGGQGPAGLNRLFERLDLPQVAGTIAKPADFSPSSIREHWRIDLSKPRQKTFRFGLIGSRKPVACHA